MINIEARGGDQLFRFRVIEIELDDRTRDVPGGVLAADQVMALMMVERVGLDQPSVTPAQPFVAIELIIGANPNDAPFEVSRIPPAKRTCRVAAECE